MNSLRYDPGRLPIVLISSVDGKYIGSVGVGETLTYMYCTLRWYHLTKTFANPAYLSSFPFGAPKVNIQTHLQAIHLDLWGDSKNAPQTCWKPNGFAIKPTKGLGTTSTFAPDLGAT